MGIMGEGKGRNLSARASWKTLLLALSAGLYWSWWDSFHELYRFTALNGVVTEGVTFLSGGAGYLQCIVKPIGLIVGCTLLIVALRRFGRGLLPIREEGPLSAGKSKRAGILLLVGQVVVWVICCAAIGAQLRFVAALAFGIASALVAPSLVDLAVRLGRLGESATGWVIVGALGCYGVCNNLFYPFFLQGAPVTLVCAVYMAVLVIAFATATLSETANEGGGVPAVVRYRTLPPWQLAVHVVVYGCIFGILHILEGLVQTGPQSVNLGVFFGCLIAIVVFCVLFMRERSGKEIWSKIRSTVFPFVIVGYLLLPLARNSDIALAFTEAGGLLYFAVLFFGCASLMRRTDVAPASIVAWALLLYSMGEAAGVSFMVGLIPSFAVASDGYFVLAVLIVVLLTAATFWVASDEQVRKLWGLRREIEPKRYHDLLTRIRVERFTERFGLTPREAEVLRMVAQGRRAPEMVEAMGVSMDTVRTHLKHLYTKLDAHSYAEVVTMVEAAEVPDSALSELLAREQ